MATVFDVAKYILEEYGEMTAMKLQKLVFYCQAWNMVWSEKVLFNERIEAWANGAVIPDLYEEHRGKFKVIAGCFSKGNSAELSPEEKDNIDHVVRGYGKYTAQQLSDLNHLEDPWKNAREGLSPLARSNKEITIDSIYEYYLGIWNDSEGE